MSSLIGHAIAGYSASRFGTRPKYILWTGWLLFAAIAPDIDYILQWVFGIRFPIRYTHSIGFCLAFSALTLLCLKLAKAPGLRILAVQILLASFSHLFLDLMVGVYPNPWLWPLSPHTFSLPFGILPSAGKISFFNRYMYRNLLIELGIILPVLFALKSIKENHGRSIFKSVAIWSIIWIPFIFWGFSLKR
jgi:inner membrane protein